MDTHNSQQNTKVSHQQLQAKKYIEENELEKVVSEMLNSLVHEKAKQPVVYMIKYLAGLLTEEERRQNGLVIPEPYPKGKPIVKFPSLEKSNSLLKKYLTKNIWSSLKYNKTKQGCNIMNVIKPGENNSEDKVGCILTDGNCLSTFNALLGPMILELHGLEAEDGGKNDQNVQTNQNINLGTEPTVDQFRPAKEFRISNSAAGQDNFPHQERISDNITSIIISYSRNLQDFAFTNTLPGDKRQQTESIILKAINTLQNDKILKPGRYLSMNRESEKEINALLKDFNFDESNIIKHGEINLGWPDNRGVYISDDKDIVLLVNFIDHFQIISRGLDFIKIYNSATNLLKAFEKHLSFEFDKYYGYITTELDHLGAGMTVSSDINLKILPSVPDLLKTIENMKFDTVQLDSHTGVMRTSSHFKLSFKTDLEFLEDYYSKISGLINLNKNKRNVELLTFNKLELADSPDQAIKRAYESTYEEYKYVFSASGNNLNSLIRLYYENPGSLGILFTEPSEYKTFHKFIREYILHSQNFDINLHDHIFKADEHRNSVPVKPSDKLLSTNICLIRNLNGHPFPCNKYNQNEKAEESILKAIDTMSMKNFEGKYYSLGKDNLELDSENLAQKLITDNNILLFHKDEFKKLDLHSDFPKNRGIVHYEKENIFVVINDIDHLKFEMQIKGGQLYTEFMEILKLSNEFSKHLKFVYDKKLGFLSACPKFLGTGIIAKTAIRLINLNRSAVESILNNTDFSFGVIDPQENIIEVYNKYTIGRSETDLLTNLVCIINKLIEEDDLAGELNVNEQKGNNEGENPNSKKEEEKDNINTEKQN